MLLRDLLVAMPGLIGPTTSPARAQEIEVQEPAQVVAPASFTLQAPNAVFSSGSTASSPFMQQALKDLYEQTDFQLGSPEPETPPAPSSPLRVQNLSADAGRVLTIDLEDGSPVSGVRILTQSSHGQVSVNPDNSLSLVLSEDPKNTADTAFRYEITYADGRTQEVQAKVDVTAGQEPEGWGKGDFYMLETGADGHVVVEHGDNHRKVYITEGAHGLTRAEIAKAEGVSASQITAKWLQEHSEYGATSDKALDAQLGMELWYAVTGRNVDPNSNWLLLERGYEYTDLGRIVSRGTTGESALNPTFIGAYGEGSDPRIDGIINIYQNKASHVVIQGLDTTGISLLGGENILFDRMSITADQGTFKDTLRFTLRDSDIIDVARDEPITSGTVWKSSPNRVSGAYISGVEGAFLDNNLFDRNGWKPGYDYNMASNKPMPPSHYNHNLYVQSTVTDITVRDNIFMRAASFGAQVRPGGMIEGNIFIDNNAAVNFFTGHNYTLALNNLVTSAGYKQVSDYEGALSRGIDGFAKETSLIGNIIAHLADPNNAAEQAIKTKFNDALAKNATNYHDDTIIYNWSNPEKAISTNADRNIEGLNTAILDQATIQNFTAQLLGKESATISDLADYLRAQAKGTLDGQVDADVINAFFRQGFGLDTTLRAEAETVRFVPDDRGDGMRWDNRLNWSSEDLPGRQDGDSVHLGGNRVLFGAETVTIDDFIFGDFGQMKATSGRLDIEGEVSTSKTGNLLQIDNAGQVWVDGYRDRDMLTLDLDGGRFANTGKFAGKASIDVSDDAQLLLATAGGRFDLASGSDLSISGGKAKVGFDGADGKTASLHLHDGAELSFVADRTGLGRISEFHSGAFETSKVTSGIRLDGDLAIDLTGLDRKAGNSWTLIDADQIIGSFDDISVSGLGRNRDALIRIDYVKDEVVLLISDSGKGSGQIRTSSTGEADFIDYAKDAALKALWADLQASTPLVTDDPI